MHNLMKFILLPLLLVSHLTSGQVLRGIVKSAKNNVGIPYVNIGIPNKGIGTVSDSTGYYRINITSEFVVDSLHFSCIGFESKVVPVAELIDSHESIELNEKTTELSLITISSTRLKKLRLGSKTTARLLVSGLGTGDLGGEIGTRIDIRKPMYLDRLHFYLTSNTLDTAILRMNLYPAEGKFPKQPLLNQNVIVIVTGRKIGWIAYDLSPFNIHLNHDFIVTLELVGYSRARGALYFSQAPPYFGPMFYRNKSMDTVKRFRGGPMGIYFTAYRLDL